MTKDEYNNQGIEKLKKLAREQFDADLVNVVRCKNCKHRYTDCPLIKIAPDGNVMFLSKNEGFCNYGEEL